MRTVLIVVAMLLLGGCSAFVTPKADQPRAAQIMVNHNESTDLITGSRLAIEGKASSYASVNNRTNEALTGYLYTLDFDLTCGAGFNTTKFTVYQTMVRHMMRELTRPAGRSGRTGKNEPVKFDPQDIAALSNLQVEIAQNCRKGPGSFDGHPHH